MLTVAYEFKTADAKTKMMNFEVRGWMTNHEAGIGTPEFMSGGVPAAGIAKSASSGAADKTSAPLGPASGKPSTIGNLYYGSKGYLAISDYNANKSFLGAPKDTHRSRTSIS